MMACDSENIVKCYDVYYNESLKIMMIEYCNGKNLQHEIYNKGRIPEAEAILIMRQLINGLVVLDSSLRKCIGITSSIAI